MSTAAGAPAPRRRRRGSELEEVAAAFRARLGDLEDGAVASLTRGLLDVDRRIAAELERVTGRIEEALEAGREPGISFRHDRGRLALLRRQVDAELRRYGGRVLEATNVLTVQAADEAIAFSRDFVRAAARDLGLPGADTFGVAPLLQRDRLVEAVANTTAGPLRELAASFGEEGAERVVAGLVQGAALGENPLRTARRIRADVVETYRGRSRLIARTEAQRVAREVSRQRYERDPAVGGWRWLSSTDRRTCPACFAMHGSLHPVEETLDGHPGCRCTMVPVLRAELRGLGTEPLIRPGEELFAELPDDAKLAVLGPSKLEAYQDGRVNLAAFAERRHSERWGSHVRASSLERAERRGPTAALPARGGASAPTTARAAPGSGDATSAPTPTPPQPTTPAPRPGVPGIEEARQFAPALERRAEALEELAERADAHLRPELRRRARALRDSWTPGETGAGAMRRRGIGNSQEWGAGDQHYRFNAGNENSWHYVNGRRRTLAQYEELLLQWSRGERMPEGFRVPADLEPLTAELLELDAYRGALRERARADRRIGEVVTAPADDWRFDDGDRRVAVSGMQAAVLEGQRLLRDAAARLAELAG